MTISAAGPPPTQWVPDYLFGSLRHWTAPTASRQCRTRRYTGGEVIHCVSRWQHLLDAMFGRPPRSRCGVRLAHNAPSALLDDGAPLCPACAAITHPPAEQLDRFNHRLDEAVRRL